MSEFINENGVIEVLDKIANTKSVENALMKCCALVERSAKQKAPKGTGELRRSIESRIDYNTSTGTIEGVVFTPLEYAPYVEYGTGIFAEGGNGRQDVPWSYLDDDGETWHTTYGMKPSPYLRPALFENREQITELLKGVIKDG